MKKWQNELMIQGKGVYFGYEVSYDGLQFVADNGVATCKNIRLSGIIEFLEEIEKCINKIKGPSKRPLQNIADVAEYPDIANGQCANRVLEVNHALHEKILTEIKPLLEYITGPEHQILGETVPYTYRCKTVKNLKINLYQKQLAIFNEKNQKIITFEIDENGNLNDLIIDIKMQIELLQIVADQKKAVMYNAKQQLNCTRCGAIIPVTYGFAIDTEKQYIVCSKCAENG